MAQLITEPNTFVTGGLAIGEPEFDRFREAFPKDGTVYIVGQPFSPVMSIPEIEVYLASLPCRKVLLCDADGMSTFDWTVAALGYWHDARTACEISTWGTPVWLGPKPNPGMLSFHTTEGVPDGPNSVNVAWGHWSGGDPTDLNDWSAFMTPYYLSMYAQTMGEGFLAPV